MRCARETLRLYAVTDRRWTGRQTLLEQVEAAIKGGATCIQLREKELGDGDFLAEAKEMLKLCRSYGVPLIINDNADVALECGADGVHVGQSDADAAELRARAGDKLIIGVSAQTVEQAKAAERAGADYLGVGAVFSTTTKLDAVDVPGDTLREICSAVSIPVVAIGGINRDNIRELSGSGVAGVALVSAIFAADDIEGECRLLRKLSEEIA